MLDDVASTVRKISQIERNVFKGSPKLPTEISEWKMCPPIAIPREFPTTSWNYDEAQLSLVFFVELRLLSKWY